MIEPSWSAEELSQIRPIDAAWRSYLRAVMPVNAGPSQVIETRRAFYAGAAALYSSLMKGLGEGDEPTREDLKLMAAISQELEHHANEVRAGRR